MTREHSAAEVNQALAAMASLTAAKAAIAEDQLRLLAAIQAAGKKASDDLFVALHMANEKVAEIDSALAEIYAALGISPPPAASVVTKH